MGKIKELQSSVIAKIAAGEVAERPASVVKELVENALDAEAQHIGIVLEEGGMKKIQVTDDGVGMEEDDLELCVKPHTTSKIETEDDLLQIGTMGFRGEALASICAVSNVSIASRCKPARPGIQDSGFKITVTNGKTESPSPLGMPIGTRVTVENLFGNIPARKEFLKQPRTEWQHVLQIVTAIALDRTDVSFKLTHNDKTVFTIPNKQSHKERFALLLGKDIEKHLIPITGEGIHGGIGKPQIASRNNQRQYLFVNNRPVKNIKALKALKEAYGTLLEPKSEPTFVLFLEVPKDSVDVNIHPRKETVRFMQESTILEKIHDTVKEALGNTDVTYRMGDHSLTLNDPGPERVNMDRGLASLLKEGAVAWDPRAVSISPDADILQLHHLYLITQSKNGILIVDQHAAHERILYEQFKEKFESRKSKIESDVLKKALPLYLGPREREIIAEELEKFVQLGFDMEIQRDAILLKAVPLLYKDRNPVELIVSVLDDLMSEDVLPDTDHKAHATLSYLACRSAIKSGDQLTLEQRRELITKLLDTKTHYTCPHGRPTHIEITLSEFDKMFKRI